MDFLVLIRFNYAAELRALSASELTEFIDLLDADAIVDVVGACHRGGHYNVFLNEEPRLTKHVR